MTTPATMTMKTDSKRLIPLTVMLGLKSEVPAGQRAAFGVTF